MPSGSVPNNGQIANYVGQSFQNKTPVIQLTYNGTSGYYPVPEGYRGYANAQQCVLGRNTSTGAIYALWYDWSVPAFRIGHILTGATPANGTGIYVFFRTSN